jgi:hypothetical protein
MNEAIWTDGAGGRSSDRISTPSNLSVAIATMLIGQRIEFEFVPDPGFDVFNFDGGKPSTVERAKNQFEVWRKAREEPQPTYPPQLMMPGMILPPRIV